ncbi:MAG TPA: DUF4382 domain-containing protein [Longimicrobiales bacterium]
MVRSQPRAVVFVAGLATALLLALTACDAEDGTGPLSAPRVQVLVTDAPSDYVASAEMWVSRIYLQGGSDMNDDDADGDGVDDGEDEDVAGRIDLFNDPDNPHHFDLLTLRDGVVAALTELEEVPAGSYAQLRLVVDSAFVTLVEGYAFETGGSTAVLKVPSGSTSGVKVKLSSPLVAQEGEATVITLDFDVDRNFVMQGNPDSPAGIKGMLFTPTIEEIERVEEEAP